MAKRRTYPSPFTNWPGTEEIRELLRPLAEALKAGDGDRAALVEGSPELPEEFGCHLPSLTNEERGALMEKVAHEDGQGRGKLGQFGDNFVRIARARKLVDRAPELYFPGPDGNPLDENLLRAWFLHAVGGLPAVQQSLFERVRGRDGESSDLEEWAERFRINLPWAVEALDYIVRSWRIDYAAWFEDRSLQAPAPLPWPIIPDGVANPLSTEDGYPQRCGFSLSFNWFPTMESRPFAERRLIAELVTEAQRHLDRIERMHQEHGYLRSRDTWNPGASAYLEEHCEQAARYHCGGMSFEELADAYPAAKSHAPVYGGVAFDRESDRVKTIRRNVRRLAGRIGLSLRPE